MSDQICKFFLKNSCRYGDRCRFLHSYPEERDYDSKRSYNRYKYLQDDFDKEKPRAPEKPSISVGDTIIALAKEIKHNYDSNMWALTVLGFGSHNVPGWEDYSPEEIRWEFMSNPNFPNEWESLKTKTHQNRQTFLNPNSQTYELVKSMLQSENNSKQSAFNTPLFGQVTQNTFGPQKSVFGNSFATPLPEETINDEEMSLGQTNIFGRVPLQSNFGSSTPLKVGAPSVFDVSTTSVFGNQQSVFSNQPIFGNVPSQSVFSAVPKQSVFGSANQFGNAPSFGQSIFASVPKQDFGHSKAADNVYSNMSDLTDEEINQFKAQTFERFKLPIKPPPRELCTA